MLQVHGEMNYNGAEAVGNFRIVGNPYLIALHQSCPSSDDNHGLDPAESSVNTARLCGTSLRISTAQRRTRKRFSGSLMRGN